MAACKRSLALVSRHFRRSCSSSTVNSQQAATKEVGEDGKNNNGMLLYYTLSW